MLLTALVAALVAASVASASTLTPPVLPLFVRNPYLSTWLTGARDVPWDRWPIFWTGNSVGFSIMASVPETGAVFPLLGRPHDSLSRTDSAFHVAFAEYLGATFDASTTNLTYRIPGTQRTSAAGHTDNSNNNTVQLTLSFLSPITPTSTFRQSIPAAYLTVAVEGAFDVNVYVDVNGEWVSGNRDNQIQWALSEEDASSASGSSASSSSPPLKTWKVSRAEQQLFTEFADRAEWGTLAFSAPAAADVRHESGVSARVRSQFARSGALANANDDAFRRIMEDEPVFAFSKTFHLNGSDSGSSSSSSSSSSDSVLFTVALLQDPVVQYASARGLTMMRPLWASHVPTADELLRYHYDDFATAARLARQYAAQLARDAFASGSAAYEEIAALSARQVLGATQFAGTPDSPLLFLKEISSNGNCQTVDVIFPAFPFFLYTNPRWLAQLLEPLLEHQLSGQYPNDYSMHDLGYHYPNHTGHGDGNDEYMPVEECGNMLIMGLALVNALRFDTKPAEAAEAASGLLDRTEARPLPALADAAYGPFVDAYGIDQVPATTTGKKEAAAWVARSYKLWKQWTGYLVREALVPRRQLSTDDFAGWLAYQTNLALKGIIGIRAMSELAAVVGADADAAHYRGIADDYVAKWQTYGIARDGTHAKLAYDWYGSWTTLYNLFADALLCFHPPKDQDKNATFIPDQIYQTQSDWYHYVLQRYGLPLDSRHLYAKSDWEFFAAAVASRGTRAEILASVARWLNETDTAEPFTDLYETEGTGGYPGGLRFMARPVVGAHFAFLALERACGGDAAAGLGFLKDVAAAGDRGAAAGPPLDVQAALDADRAPFLRNGPGREQAPMDEL